MWKKSNFEVSLKIKLFQRSLKSSDEKNFKKKNLSKTQVFNPGQVLPGCHHKWPIIGLQQNLAKSLVFRKALENIFSFSVEKGNWYVPIFSAVLQVLIEISKINLLIFSYLHLQSKSLWLYLLIGKVFFLSKYNIYCKRIWKILVCTFF